MKANKSWQPTPGLHMAVVPMPMARSGCTQRWAHAHNEMAVKT